MRSCLKAVRTLVYIFLAFKTTDHFSDLKVAREFRELQILTPQQAMPAALTLCVLVYQVSSALKIQFMYQLCFVKKFYATTLQVV